MGISQELYILTKTENSMHKSLLNAKLFEIWLENGNQKCAISDCIEELSSILELQEPIDIDDWGEQYGYEELMWEEVYMGKNEKVYDFLQDILGCKRDKYYEVTINDLKNLVSYLKLNSPDCSTNNIIVNISELINEYGSLADRYYFLYRFT